MSLQLSQLPIPKHPFLQSHQTPSPQGFSLHHMGDLRANGEDTENADQEETATQRDTGGLVGRLGDAVLVQDLLLMTEIL